MVWELGTKLKTKYQGIVKGNIYQTVSHKCAKYKKSTPIWLIKYNTVFHVSFTGIIFSEFNEFPENR